METKCSECGSAFVKNANNQIYCDPCRQITRLRYNNKYLRKRREDRGCIQKGSTLACIDCGGPFIFRAGVQKRCVPCLKKERRRQSDAYQSKNPDKVKRWAKTSNLAFKMGGNRVKALERDNHTCQACGHQPSNCVHHKDGKGDNYPSPNHSIGNLVTLCKTCHSRLHAALEREFYARHPDTVMAIYDDFVHSAAILESESEVG